MKGAVRITSGNDFVKCLKLDLLHLISMEDYLNKYMRYINYKLLEMEEI